MTAAQQAHVTRTERGLLARPLDTLVFLLPLILFYEAVSFVRPERVIAFDLMRRFFELFGGAGVWAPGLGVIIILLATHIASGEKWSIRWGRVGWMYAEAAALALPLLILNWAIPLVGTGGVGGQVGAGGMAEASAVGSAEMIFAPTLGASLASPLAVPVTASPLIEKVALGVGAGIYEELVFRLVLISLIVIVGVDVLRLRRGSVAVAAVILSSLAFAAHHHQPVGTEPFDVIPFIFRTIAGAYLAIVFWYRGYGPAAGCHAAYNVALACLGADVA